ncbi:MAG: acyl-CoA dehydrogenase family protein [Polyangia bacterium]
MNFDLTEEQILMRDTARKFAEDRIAPTIDEDEEAHRFRPELAREMGELGFFGSVVEERYGGTEAGHLVASLMAEAVAEVSASWGLPFNMQMNGPALTIQKFGNDDQKEKYIEKLVEAEWLGCFAITEPNMGSDVAALKTTATEADGGFVLNGSKTWISQGHVADVGLVYAYTDKDKGSKGMSCFIVDLKKTEGVTTVPIESKFGLFCAPTSEIYFEDAFVPAENMLGERGKGFKICMTMLDVTRLSCAARAVGVGGACIRAAVDYANERTQFGKPIGSFQMIQEQIAEMVAEHEAAKLLVYRAAANKDAHPEVRNTHEVSVGKYIASESAVFCANTAMKILGSYGYSTEYPICRFLRDSKSYQIVEGTSNIQKMIISRHALGGR